MKHPPYHLRTNKSVDRLLLVETIRALGSSDDYRDFTYYTLSGPFLEDLKVIDHFFPKMKLISFESNQQTHLRQEYHKFNSNIDLRNMTLQNFLAKSALEDDKSIFWLDYTDLRFSHFGEFQRVLEGVLPGSVVRITLRADADFNINALKDRVTEAELSRIKADLEAEFRRKYLAVLPPDDIDTFATPKNYARMVQMMVRRAASAALDQPGNDTIFLPVQSTRYDDNTQMLSVTGVVCLRKERTELEGKLAQVRFACLNWEEPTELNIPALSTKERLCLERYLPVTDKTQAGDILHNALGYNIDNGVANSKERLAEYAEYFRDYPHFVKMWD